MMTLIYKYRRRLSLVICVLHSFSKTVVFYFPLGSWPILPQPWLSEQCLGWISAHRVGLKSNRVLVGHSRKLSAIIALEYFAGRSSL